MGTDNMGTAEGAAGRDPEKGTRTAMNTGGNTGNNVGTLQDEEFKSHFHAFGRGAGSVAGGGGNGLLDGTFETDDRGGNETRPINAYINYLIKT